MLQVTLSEVVLRPSSLTLGGSGQDRGEERDVRSHSGGGEWGKGREDREPTPSPIQTLGIFRPCPGILNFPLQCPKPQQSQGLAHQRYP
jgi:hypothetical protein